MRPSASWAIDSEPIRAQGRKVKYYLIQRRQFWSPNTMERCLNVGVPSQSRRNGSFSHVKNFFKREVVHSLLISLIRINLRIYCPGE